MIDEDLANETVALLGTAAAMLIEDAQDLVTRPLDASEAASLGATLSRLGDDLSALAGAVRVISRMSDGAEEDGRPAPRGSNLPIGR